MDREQRLRPSPPCLKTWEELELELIQPRMAQKPVLRGEVGCACVAREVSVRKYDKDTTQLLAQESKREGTMNYWPSGRKARATHIEMRFGDSLSSTGERAGFVDSTREEDKARTVAEIYRIHLKRGRYPWLPPL